jgi:pheromone shutdown-related protein TraB
VKKEVNLGDRQVILVGTAHVSEESRREVRDTIEEEQPDLVGVELDENRLKSLREESGWKDLDLSEAIREGQAPLLLMNLGISIYQRHLGLDQGVKPGQEMLEAVDAAEEAGVEYALLDRDINETLSRAFSELGIWEKFKLLGSAMMPKESPDIDVEKLKQENILDALVEELQEEFPSLSKVFLEERNSFMAEKLLEKDFDKAVVVVGAAHVEGMAKDLEKNTTYSVEEGSGISWFKVLSYGIPAFIIAGIAYSFYQIGFSTGVNATTFWILSNGILAMLGAIVARSHISTWITSFVAAPLTSLDPALGAGMVASYAEAKLHPPTVEEMEEVTKVERYRDLWSNQAGRILLTFFFVTLGSAAATFISAGYIASLIGL